MTTLAIGQLVPHFELPATGGKTLALANFQGKKTTIVFLP